MNGTVTLALYKGNIDIAGRKSETSLYRPDIASFTMGAATTRRTPRDSFAFWACRHARVRWSTRRAVK